MGRHSFTRFFPFVLILALFLGLSLFPASALAAESQGDSPLASMGLLWVIPFAGILLSIAIFPLVAPDFWHHHYGKIGMAWAFALLIPFVLFYGVNAVEQELLHTLLLEYVPFIILLFSLFTVAGGILIRGNLRPTPSVNTAFLGVGTVLASIVGTTGASMVLIRPLIRTNNDRKHQVHLVVFFIFLVSNIGGSLTPIGDPPLFLGFLKGVDFFWPTVHMILPMLMTSLILLALFYAMDRWFFKHDGLDEDPDPRRDGANRPIHISGWANVGLLLVVVGSVVLSGVWDPKITYHVGHIELKLQDLVRDGLLLGTAFVSLWITPSELRAANGFNWEPIAEVAKLFIAIFITIIPAIAILKAGPQGALSDVLTLVTLEDGRPNNIAYFWLTGGFSSFLDNAPTYLIFFNMAGGDAQTLMGPLAGTLLAISLGAVFMGANTYIGNAPNFMVRSIAIERGIQMPSFFGYMVWSGIFLIPTFLLVMVVFMW